MRPGVGSSDVSRDRPRPSGDGGGDRARSKAARRSRLRRAALALLASSALGLLVAEFVCRGLYGVPLRERLPLMQVRANKTRGFEMIPGSEHYTYLERVRVNNLGLRGEDVQAKELGEVRVLALGDSLTYGQGMGEEETLPHALEVELARRFSAAAGAAKDPRGTSDGGGTSAARTVRVINGGVRAYNTRQELALLAEKWALVKPDVVVLLWFANDVDDPDIDALYARFEKSGPVVFDLGEPMNTRRELAWYVKQLFRRSALVMQARHAYTDAHWPVSSQAAIDRAFERLDGYLESFARLADQGGFEFVVAVVPLARVARDPDAVHPHTARVKELAQRHGFPFLDLVQPVRELYRSSGKLPVLAYDGHYDAQGNAALGKYVADALWTLFPQRFGAR